MKNKILYTVAALLLGFTATSCRDESLLSYGNGEGKMTLRTSVMSDIKVVSRALSEEQQNDLCTKALIWISDSQRNLLYKYNGLSSFPADGLKLTSGTYLAEAWVGDSIPASWDGIRYHGTTPFDITTGTTTPVDVVCTVRNTLVSLRLSDQLADVLSDVSMTVELNDGITDGSHGLTFGGDNLASKGYYMINSRTKGFKWTLKGTDNNGKEFSKTGEYTDPDVSEAPFLSRATEYIFNVKFNAEAGDVEIGGAYFDIEVKPEPVEGTVENVLIALAPEIVGIDGLDITRPVLAAPGNIGRQSIHVIGSTRLSKVVISGNILSQAGLEVDYDLLTMSDAHKAALQAAGITFKAFDNSSEAVEGSTAYNNLRLNLEETLTNSLKAADNGDAAAYELVITATDVLGKTSTATLSINISEAPGQLVETPVEELTYTTGKLIATVSKPGTRMGFEVKESSDSRAFEDWTFVEGVLNGSELAATLTDLIPGHTYAYRLVIDGFTSPEVFTITIPSPQLPNAGFEDWQDSKAPFLIYASGNEMFWDSGNHGSATMSKNVTVPDNTIKHSGNYSVKLASQYVGLMPGLGKFAAGNVFIGEYLKTDGTNGVLGWGRKFESPVKPKALRGYVRYEPKVIDCNDGEKVPADIAEEYAKGNMDKGIIYIALLSGSAHDTYTLKGTEYSAPVLVITKAADRRLFDSNASYVVSYGEKVFTEATPGNGMVEFEIPLNDVHGGDFEYIMVVASASKGGDYFMGGDGSTMWLDDLELVY